MRRRITVENVVPRRRHRSQAFHEHIKGMSSSAISAIPLPTSIGTLPLTLSYLLRLDHSANV